MPRPLPWLKNRTTTTTTAPAAKKQKLSPSPPKKRQRRLSVSAASSSSDDDDDNDDGKDGLPPKVEYMHPSTDDTYIMVEDELLSTAQLYTRAVHRAEYHRLHLAATSKNAKHISEIQRPVAEVERMSREALEKAKIKAGIQKGKDGRGEEEGSEVEDAGKSVWGNSSLGSLMCSPKKKDRDLTERWGVRPVAVGGVERKVPLGEKNDTARRKLFTANHKPPPRPAKPSKTPSNLPFSAPFKKENHHLPRQPRPRPRPPPHRHHQDPSTPTTSSGETTTDDENENTNDLDLDSPTRPTRPNPSKPLPTTTIAATTTAATETTKSKAPPPPPPLPPTTNPQNIFDFDFSSLQPEIKFTGYKGRSMASRKKSSEGIKKEEEGG